MPHAGRAGRVVSRVFARLRIASRPAGTARRAARVRESRATDSRRASRRGGSAPVSVRGLVLEVVVVVLVFGQIVRPVPDLGEEHEEEHEDDVGQDLLGDDLRGVA